MPTPTSLPLPIILQDTHNVFHLHQHVTRYNPTRDSLITMGRTNDLFILKDHRSQSTHTLDAQLTSPERLAAHWDGFTTTHLSS